MEPRPDDPTYTPAFVQSLLRAEVPSFSRAEVTWLDRGWDSDVFRVGSAHVVRLARNASAALGLIREAEVLPRIAPHLTLPIPTPVHFGTIPGCQQLCFGIYSLMPGVTPSTVELGPSEYAKLAPVLGGFMRALHNLNAADYEAAVPEDELGRLDAARRGADTRASLETLAREGALTREQHQRLVSALDQAEASTLTLRTVLLHGDLHGANMLIDREGFTGIMDWIDLHRGHPATDLSAAFVCFPEAARAALFDAYGETEPSSILWARWRAITMLTAAITGCLARSDGSGTRYCVGRLRGAATH